jgi:hypothetical protein
MVLFGSILFGTPPLIKLYKYCRPHAAASRDPSAALEMWDFQDEFDDMRGVKDPLEQENKRGRKGQKKKKKKKGGKEAGAK